MKNQVLSIKQMQELKELGIDTSKASMCWIGCTDGNDVYPYNSTFKDIFESHKETIPSVLTPTFTLQDILEILPREIKPFKGCKSWKVWLRLLPYVGNRWCVLYENPDEIFYKSEGENPLEAAFNILKWCKQNNYI